MQRGPPPKNCPICGARIWSREGNMNVNQVRGLYNAHVHTNHPQYETWNKRVSLSYLITIVLAVALPAAAFQVTSNDFATLLTVLLWAATSVVGVGILVVQRKGRKRFRDLWNEEHGSPIEPN